MRLCRFFDAQNKKVGMPLRLLVGAEEWVVPYDGYTPRWQDLCDPQRSALDRAHGQCMLAESHVVARQKEDVSVFMAVQGAAK